MDREKIIEVLSRWNAWKADVDAGIYRNRYLGQLEKLAKTGQVIAVTGARRSGKSTLMKQFIKRRMTGGADRLSFLYINFEEPAFAGLLSASFLQQAYEAYVEIVRPSGTPWLLLDEVQNVPGWERAVRGLHEKKEANIIVSGSTSSLLSKELGTLLAGRWLEMKVYPLDFREFLEFKGIAIAGRLDMLANKTQVKQLLREYLEFGGFPLAVLQDQKTQILQTYFDDILSRDVAERHRIRKVDRLRLLAKHYLTGFAAHISYRKAATMAGLSLQSAERFSAHLQDAFLVFFVAQFSYSLRQQVANPKVVYAIDTGIANAVGFRFSENVGRLYENLVFLSLLQQSQEVYYYKGKAECDFVVKEGQRVVQAIQVCYELGANKERELNGLNEAMAAFQLDEGTVITEGFEGEEQQAGKKVKYVPLWKWLLR